MAFRRISTCRAGFDDSLLFFVFRVLLVSGEPIDLPTGSSIFILGHIGMACAPIFNSLHPIVYVDFVAATHQLAHNLPTNLPTLEAIVRAPSELDIDRPE